MRVLVADDEPDVVSVLRQVVELAGHECRTADCGVEALVLALDWRPDAAILDIGMPVASGLEVAEGIRAAGMDAWLIAFSGWCLVADAQRAIAAGFDVFLGKPADVQTLTAALKRTR